MPIIHLNLMEGRSVDQKRECAKQVTKAVSETLQVPEDRVRIMFHDMKEHDYSVGGVLKEDM